MKVLLILLSLSLTAGIIAASQNPATSVDPAVWQVESAGAWADGGQIGHYRAVTYKRCSSEHCYDTLFVEWLANGEKTRVVATKQVDEVGDLTVVSEARFVPSQSGTRLQIRHEAVAGQLHSTRCLQLGPPGKYIARDGECR
jgi:hypothetical protein